MPTMKVLNTNGWMYAVELEEPRAGQPGKYFFGNKVRGIVTSDLPSAMENMQVPEVPKDANVVIPKEIEQSIGRALSDEKLAQSGELSGDSQHEHISQRHVERHPIWPRIAKRLRAVLHHGVADENTASIDEIYDRYV